MKQTEETLQEDIELLQTNVRIAKANKAYSHARDMQRESGKFLLLKWSIKA